MLKPFYSKQNVANAKTVNTKQHILHVLQLSNQRSHKSMPPPLSLNEYGHAKLFST